MSHGVLTRQVLAEVPPGVESRLTERGRSLEPIRLALSEWGHDDLVHHRAGAPGPPSDAG